MMLDLDIVIPLWNEENRIERTLNAIIEHASTLPLSVMITLVDNGSVDRTAEIVDRASANQRVKVRLLGCSRQGKGAAVRRGMLASQARWVGFCDADLATAPEALEDVLVELTEHADVVIGSRRCPGAALLVKPSLGRQIGSLGFRVLTKPITGAYDSQCGFKFFTREAAQDIFSRSVVNGFTFDVEILGLARKLGYTLREIPVAWTDQEGSSLSITRDAPEILKEVLQLRRALRTATPSHKPTRNNLKTVVVNWRDRVSPQSGGAELYCEQLADQLGRDREVVYLTGRPACAAKSETRENYRVVRGGGTYGVYLFVLAWLLVHRRSIGAVVDSQNGIPFFTPLVLKRRTAITLLIHHVHQAEFSEYFPRPVAAFGRWLEGPVSRVIYGRRPVVAVSPSTRHDVRSQLKLRGNIEIVPCGMDQPTVERDRSVSPRIVVVGRLVTHKRFDRLVNAVNALSATWPDLELHMIGDGPEMDNLKRLGGSNTFFHGRVDDPVRDDFMRSAWLTVNPSISEGWGLSVLEANTFGVPAVAYRVRGLQDAIIEGETGWLLDEASDLGLALETALRALSHPDTMEHYERSAVSWSRNFSWVDSAKMVDTVLDCEHKRLAAGKLNRRAGNDLVTLVEIPRDLLAENWKEQQRTGDTWATTTSSAHGLLKGADEADAGLALRRLGVDRRDPRVRVAVARPHDLLRHHNGLMVNEVANDVLSENP